MISSIPYPSQFKWSTTLTVVPQSPLHDDDEVPTAASPQLVDYYYIGRGLSQWLDFARRKLLQDLQRNHGLVRGAAGDWLDLSGAPDSTG